MNRGVDHQPIFFGDVDRLEIGARLADIHERFGVRTLAYCLMTNHVHLVVRAPHGALPDAMHHMTSTYSHRLNARRGRDGPLFRGRYHSIPVESDEYLLWVTRYVHRNPLDITGVSSARDHRWSSHRTYLGLRPPPSFLDLAPVMDLLGGRIDELEAITEQDAPARLATVDDLTHLVRCALAVEDLAGGVSPGPVAKTGRTLLVLLGLRTHDPHLSTLIEEALGSRIDADPRRAGRRAVTRLRSDPCTARTLMWLERQLAVADVA